MSNKLFKRGLVVGIIVLFIGIGIQPAIAIEKSDNEDTIKQNDTQLGIWNWGIIIFETLEYYVVADLHLPDAGVKITCEDLNTGKVKNIITNFFGFRIGFFPRGHNFRFYVPYPYDKEIIIEDLGYLRTVVFEYPILY